MTQQQLERFDLIFVSRSEDHIQIRTDVGEDRLEEDAPVAAGRRCRQG
jgi:hypothetical protein